MKTRQQSLHDEGRQSRPGKEGDAQKFDDIRVAEGAHKLTFPHELGRGSADLGRGDLGAVQEDVVDLLCGADGSRHGYLLHAAIGSGADSDASESHVREDERPQLRILGEKAFRGHFSCCGSRQCYLPGLSVATVQDEWAGPQSRPPKMTVRL